MYHKAALASVVSWLSRNPVLSADWNCWGLVATAYYYVLKHAYICLAHASDFVSPYFPSGIPSWNYVWIATTIGGFLVGLTLHFMGLPGEVACE